jgi:hypothetical protein
MRVLLRLLVLGEDFESFPQLFLVGFQLLRWEEIGWCEERGMKVGWCERTSNSKFICDRRTSSQYLDEFFKLAGNLFAPDCELLVLLADLNASVFAVEEDRGIDERLRHVCAERLQRLYIPEEIATISSENGGRIRR